MSTPEIHVFNHHAMATVFQLRIAGEERGYAAQAARTMFDLADQLEAQLSRFRENSDISQVARLAPGESLRLSEATFACLAIGREMELVTRGAFSMTAAALRTQALPPRWSLADDLSITCEEGKLEFDLGAIGKGFALDRMAEELADWDCPSFLLVAGGSSVLAGAAPTGMPGWSSGLGDDNAERRFWLEHCSLSGSGVAVKGEHIIDPRTGQPARQRSRAWALSPSAAVSDALSTACMVLSEMEIAEIMHGQNDWLVFLKDGSEWRQYGDRATPVPAAAE
jgi:thiamine biosynthesis lipoprotein